MNKHKYYKPPKPSTLPQRPIDLESRPQFITDFSDPDKYKLSEAEMIQKKAALQSKNREAAKLYLEERKRKLEMGIVDDETRKIYETALLAKRIDINPTIRRNLSQMIQYERERSANKNSRRDSASKCNGTSSRQLNSQEEDSNEGFEGEIKNTQHFIKKLEKAKKVQNIGRAVDILLDEKKSSNFGPTKTSSMRTMEGQTKEKPMKNEQNVNQSKMSIRSQEETLQNIQQTIKFMEEKLFGPKWKKIKNSSEESISLSANNSVQPNKIQTKYFDEKQSAKQQISYNEFMSGFPSANHPNTFSYGSASQDQEMKKQNEQSFEMEAQLKALKLNFQAKTNINLFNGLKNDNSLNLKKGHEEVEVEDQGFDQCLSTIRKMKEMIESNSHLYDNQDCFRQKQNNNVFNQNFGSHKTYRSDAEVDFSLTLDEDGIKDINNEMPREISFVHNKSKLKNSQMTGLQASHYDQMKRSLFQEIEKMNGANKSKQMKSMKEKQEEEQCSYDIPVQYQQKNQTNFKKLKNMRQKQSFNLEQNNEPEKGIFDTRSKEININSKMNPNFISKELDELKNIVHNTKSNVDGIRNKIVVPQSGGKSMMGFDYRGSINIKKHIVQK